MSSRLNGLVRRWLGLPPGRRNTEASNVWVPMADGTRLSTWHIEPVGDDAAPVVLIRTPYGLETSARIPLRLGHLIAEGGYHVVMQDVRGRYASEGVFEPFVNEADDGQTTLDWISEQPWGSGKIGLIGASYLAYTAWAALGRGDERVGALVSLIGSHDLYPVFYASGVFGLATALEWAAGVGEHEAVPPGTSDLDRGLAFQPVREADRVALRRVDFYRTWIDHPRRDAYWQSLCTELPEQPPPTLLLAGWYDFFLGPQLADHARLAEASARGAAQTELVIGPWSHGRLAHRRFRGRENGAGVMLRETLSFLDRTLRGETPVSTPAPVRYFVAESNRWRDAASWPPAGSGTGTGTAPDANRLHLRRGRRLTWDPPDGDDGTDSFHYDPSDPTPGIGGALFPPAGGAADQRPLEGRSDVVCYRTEPLARSVEVAGPVRAVLHVASSAPDTDFVARLIDVAPNGEAIGVCEGLARCRLRGVDPEKDEPRWLEPGKPVELTIDLWATAWCFRAGHQIRLDVASACWPRFERNPNTRCRPSLAGPDDSEVAEQTVYRSADRASFVELPILS